MKIGLIDVDGHNYPNLALMKISAYHKTKGDTVDWYNPLFSGHVDRVYMSKVFSFSPDYPYFIDSDEVIKGGTGYAIKLEDDREIYIKKKDSTLPAEIEHIMPDYSLYNIKDTAYGFLSRGCPRGCHFCHVKQKEGCISEKVADLQEFWNGQKFIEILDPNTLACRDWKDLLQQLIDSEAKVNFNQGLDIRMMTEEKAEMLSHIKIDRIHFAWDRFEDKDIIEPKFKFFRDRCSIRAKDLQVYVLCGDIERRIRDEDLYRIDWLKANGYAPYIMLYDKQHIPKGNELIQLQRFVNNRRVFWSCETYKEYERKTHERR